MRRRCGGRDRGRARGHQEGQEGRGRGRKEVAPSLRGSGTRGHEAHRRARQSRREVPRDAAQHRVRRGRRAGAARRPGVRAAPVEALIAKWRAARNAASAKPLTFMNLSGQAVGGLLRTSRSTRRTCWSSSTKCSCRWQGCGRGARGSAGGHNGLKSIIEHLGQEFARLRVGVGRGDARRDLADHVLAQVRLGRARGGRAHDRARGRCGGDVHHVGDRGGDEPVQRRRCQATTE